jgi:hypothetical protein
MVGLPCLVSQCAKLHVAGWKWAVFTRVSGEVYDFYSVSPEYLGYTLVSTPRTVLDRVGRRRLCRDGAVETAAAERILGPGDPSVLSVRCVS